MQHTDATGTSRRNVLRTAGAVGLASLAGLSGTAAARHRPKGNGFGRANGIGAFLNEPALYKDAPVWGDGIVDMTGQETVTVVVGAQTDADIPGAPFTELPVAFAPVAVTVSPGTEVVWTWPTYPDPVPPIPHDVVSLTGLFNSGIRPPGAPDFTHTFDVPGTYLYYCTPHGAPFEVHERGDPTLPLVYNEFGMRGAVQVVGA